jgi:hypothetical protein
MTSEHRDPFERAGAILGFVILVLTLGPLLYAMLPIIVPWLYQ